MFFSKPKGTQVTDIIYINENGFHAAIAKWMEQNPNGIVAVWFQMDLESLRRALHNIPENKFTLADRLAFVHLDEGKPIMFAGHHPLHSNEQSICDELGLKQMLVISHLGMPLFSYFGGQNIQELMSKMGLKEDEPVTNSMITKAIARAQEKIASKVIADMHANSEEEWMRMNVNQA